MEHRRRTLSSVLDEETIDNEEKPVRRRNTSVSVDDQLEEFTEFMYEGSYNLTYSVFSGLLKLICPCFRNKAAEINITE